MKLFSATTNPGKLREFRAAFHQLAGGRFDVEPLPGLKGIPPAPEHGSTFEENAVEKALYYGAHNGGWLFADDSGLVVDALGGEPGVQSARYAGPGSTDGANNALLLSKLAGAEDRTARFVCVVALVGGARLLGTFRGEVEGRIIHLPRGTNGFGYDPLFFYPPYGRTLAEVSEEEKLAVSHRGKALKAMLERLSARE